MTNDILRIGRRGLLAASILVPAAALSLNAVPALAQSTDVPSVSALQAPDQRSGEFADVNGARIFYEATGEGPPLMLLHGYPLSGALFARVRDALQGEHTVITLDHRGYGKSEAPGTPGSIEVYAEDALAVMDELGIEQAAVGGMSMGGPIVFEMYRQAPERFSSMILIDTIAAEASPAEAGLWRGVAEMVETDGVASIIPFLMPNMLTGETRTDMPDVPRYLETVMKQATDEAAIGGATALAERPDSTDTLKRIDVPTLILVGLADPVYAVEIAEKMNEAIGNSTLEIIPGASHAAIFEQPGPAAEAIGAFLGEEDMGLDQSTTGTNDSGTGTDGSGMEQEAN